MTWSWARNRGRADRAGRGEWDFCRDGRYTERGVKELHGYGAQLWRIEPEYTIGLDLELGDCGMPLKLASVLAVRIGVTGY